MQSHADLLSLGHQTAYLSPPPHHHRRQYCINLCSVSLHCPQRTFFVLTKTIVSIYAIVANSMLAIVKWYALEIVHVIMILNGPQI